MTEVSEITTCIKCGELKKLLDGHTSRWTEYVTLIVDPEMEDCEQCRGTGKEKWTRGQMVRMLDCSRCDGIGRIIAPTFLCCCCDAEINHNGACNLHAAPLV